MLADMDVALTEFEALCDGAWAPDAHRDGVNALALVVEPRFIHARVLAEDVTEGCTCEACLEILFRRIAETVR